MKVKYKLILALGVSFILTKVIFGSGVFLANTPRINHFFIADLEYSVKEKAKTLALLFSIKKNKESNSIGPKDNPLFSKTKISKKSKEAIEKAVYKSVSKGVYAGTYNNLKVVKFVGNEIEWEKMTIRTKSGKMITLKYPKNQPPVKEIVDALRNK